MAMETRRMPIEMFWRSGGNFETCVLAVVKHGAHPSRKQTALQTVGNPRQSQLRRFDLHCCSYRWMRGPPLGDRDLLAVTESDHINCSED